MERIHCPNCERPVEDARAIGCEECGTLFADWDRQQALELHREAADLKEQLDRWKPVSPDDVAWSAVKKLWVYAVGGFTLLSIFFGVSIWDLRKRAIDHIDSEVAMQFSKPEVRETFDRVVRREAQAQADQILEENVRPTLDSFERFIAEEEQRLSNQVAAIRKEFDAKLVKLGEQVAFFDQLHRVESLEARAMGDDWAAFEELEALGSDDPSMKGARVSSILRVKAFYLSTSRHSGITLQLTREDGSTPKNDELTTRELLRGLRELADPRRRAKAAELLGKRRHPGVPEALLNLMSSDSSISVRRTALRSFEQVCEFDANDAFGFAQAESWYDENRDELAERLRPDPDAKMPAAAGGDRMGGSTP